VRRFLLGREMRNEGDGEIVPRCLMN